MAVMVGTRDTEEADPRPAQRRATSEAWAAQLMENLRILREQRNWSQTDVCVRLAEEGYDIAQPTLARMEAGNRAVRLAEVHALAMVFGISPTELLATGGLDAELQEREEQRSYEAVMRRYKMHLLLDQLIEAAIGPERAAAMVEAELIDPKEQA